MRKSFFCVKTVLGKVSACKFSVCFFWRSLCVQFSQCLFLSVQKICLKLLFCAKASLWEGFCVKLPTCLCLCPQKHLHAQHRYVKTSFFVEKTSVCKGVCVQKFLCAQTSLCMNTCALKLLCVKASARNVVWL